MMSWSARDHIFMRWSLPNQYPPVSLVTVPTLPLPWSHDRWNLSCRFTIFEFLITLHWHFTSPSPNSHNAQVCSGSWLWFENTSTYWNVGQSAYCPWPPWGTFVQISPKFHGRVLVSVDMEFNPSWCSWRGCVSGCASTYSKHTYGHWLSVRESPRQ